jgi:predicted flap endonuclease-1-like 5' DNA nuclease
MSHLILELILWMLFAFFVGCIIGCLLHRLFGGVAVATRPADVVTERPAAAAAIENPADIERPAKPVSETPKPKAAPAAAMEEPLPPAAKPARSKGKAAAKEEPLALAGKPARPKGIEAARSGKADNLQRISGIGPKNEKTLHRLGFFHFDQIAAWSAEEIAWVDDHLNFNGRILREEWSAQARLLADGKDDEFRQLYGTGGLRNKKGETESGTRTRKS